MLNIVSLLFVIIILAEGQSVHFVYDNASHLDITKDSHQVMIEDKCAPAKPCRPGVILSVWEPQVLFK